VHLYKAVSSHDSPLFQPSPVIIMKIEEKDNFNIFGAKISNGKD